jgi:hypothetical protein
MAASMADKENPQEPHDVLAAEEFAVGSDDPQLHDAQRSADENGPRDVLAAEEFELPAPDPALHREDLKNLPPDLVGVDPQEVLAAEEFAMPSPEEAHLHVHQHHGHAHVCDCGHHAGQCDCGGVEGTSCSCGGECHCGHEHDHEVIDLRVIAGGVLAVLTLGLLGRRRLRKRTARRAAAGE